MKKFIFYFLLFPFYFLFPADKNGRCSPGFGLYKSYSLDRMSTAAIQAIQQLGDINGFEINRN